MHQITFPQLEKSRAELFGVLASMPHRIISVSMPHRITIANMVIFFDQYAGGIKTSTITMKAEGDNF